MTEFNLGKLKEITDLRGVWPHEALDFTPWLSDEENLSLLADELGIDGIELEERESSVGDFNVDIYSTERGTGKRIIIENQQEETDHDHLGKIITYASGKSASIIIWVVRKAREEHRAAIEWLNNHIDKDTSFFLLEIKLYQINDSLMTPKFEVIEKPNDWSKEQRENLNDSPMAQARRDYWQAFNDYAFLENSVFSKQFSKRKVSSDSSVSFGIGSKKAQIRVYQVRSKNQLEIDFLIFDDKEFFYELLNHKTEIEKSLGFTLNWEELPNNKASKALIIKDVDFENLDAYKE